MTSIRSRQRPCDAPETAHPWKFQALSNIDISALKSLRLAEKVRLQFRAECFNAANHANFAIPDNDIASPNFGRALQAAAPRLFQIGLKLIY